MSVVIFPNGDQAIVRQMMREICKGLPVEQTEHFTAGAIAMLEMGSSIANINRVARYTVRKAQIQCG